MTKLKNTDEKKSTWFVSDGAYYCTEHRVKNCLICSEDMPFILPSNPEKQGDDWESRFDEEIYIPHEPDCSQTILLKSRDCDCGMDRHEGEIKQFIRQVEKQTRESVRKELNDCACQEKWTFNVVHRKDKPCYLAPREEKVNE